mmetsp:Transcript_44838/g.128072  ORF Transcript_44838/g.128072 Transcript_44838/m.128072 type:complete len:96 (-) Transcript_44838:57-344(-)
MEPAAANPTTVDAVQRYGGSTAPSVPWPVTESTSTASEVEDRFDRIEKLLQQTLKKVNKGSHQASSKRGSRSGGSAMGGSASVSASVSAGSEAEA